MSDLFSEGILLGRQRWLRQKFIKKIKNFLRERGDALLGFDAPPAARCSRAPFGPGDARPACAPVSVCRVVASLLRPLGGTCPLCFRQERSAFARVTFPPRICLDSWRVGRTPPRNRPSNGETEKRGTGRAQLSAACRHKLWGSSKRAMVGEGS